jgi:hypothetical protein
LLESRVKEVAVAADECIVTRRFVVLVAFLALVCAAPAAAFADGTILVKFASGSGAGAKVAALGDDVTGKTVGDVQVVDPQPGESLSEALAHYRARPDVLYAERNTVLHRPPPPGPRLAERSFVRIPVGARRDLGAGRLVALPGHVLAQPVGADRNRRHRGRRDASRPGERLRPERDLPERYL